MTESVRIEIEDTSRVAEARRVARTMAQKSGFDQSRSEEVAIVVTEACTNLIKHAAGGELLMRTASDGSPDFEILALDRGPGMANLERCLRDGFSTVGSAGQGLGAITRLSSMADFYCVLKKGTALLARWSVTSSKQGAPLKQLAHQLKIGAVNVCKPGQEVSGDSWGVEQAGDITTVMVADGLGHGIDAKTASAEAIRILRLYPTLNPEELVVRAHQALRSTRGAAIAVARIDRNRETVLYSGLGNISAQLYSGSEPQQHLVSVNGIVGHQMQKTREFSYPWPKDGMLLMYSDGLSTSTGLETHAGLAFRDPSLIAGVLYRDFARRNDDATVVVAKAA